MVETQIHPPPQQHGVRPSADAGGRPDTRGHDAQAAAPPSAPVGLSIVVPVYRGAATVGRLVEALSALRPAGGIEIVLVNDGSPDNSGAGLPRAGGERHRAPHLPGARAQLRRAQRGYDRAAPRPRRLRHHHGRRPAEPAGGGAEALRPRPARRLGRGVHPLRREEARGVAQPRQPLRQPGGGHAARQAEEPLPVLLPLHERDGGAGGHPVLRPLSLRGRADHAGDAADRQHRGAAPRPRRRGAPTTRSPG